MSRDAINFTFICNWPVRAASAVGKENSLKFLLARDEVDPTVVDGQALHMACLNGHDRVSRIFILYEISLVFRYF